MQCTTAQQRSQDQIAFYKSVTPSPAQLESDNQCTKPIGNIPRAFTGPFKLLETPQIQFPWVVIALNLSCIVDFYETPLEKIVYLNQQDL